MAALLTRPRLDQGVIAHGATVRFLGLVRDIGQPQLLLKDGAVTYVETTPYRCEALPAQTGVGGCNCNVRCNRRRGATNGHDQP